jgi:hypothetical protein
VTADQALVALAVVAAFLLLALTLERLRQVSAQLAVLTLRVTDLVDAVAELNADLRAELEERSTGA